MKKAHHLKRHIIVVSISALLVASNANSTAVPPVLTPRPGVGVPIYDISSAFDRAMQIWQLGEQLLNWEQNLKNLIRGKLEEIGIVKKVISAQLKYEADNLFKEREKQCENLSNRLTKNYCTRTVQLEREKFDILMKIDEKVAEAFNKVKAKQREYNRISNTEGSGKKSKIEQEITQIMDKLDAEVEQQMALMRTKDTLIQQYKQARIMLTKNQLKGSQEKKAQTMLKGITAGWLLRETKRYENKAQELRNKSKSISQP